jgi:hypothetical protein
MSFFSFLAMSESLFVHFGQAGYQTGNAWCLELFCLEHSIRPDDQFPSEKDVQSEADSISAFLSTGVGKHATTSCTFDLTSESKRSTRCDGVDLSELRNKLVFYHFLLKPRTSTLLAEKNNHEPLPDHGIVNFLSNPTSIYSYNKATAAKSFFLAITVVLCYHRCRSISLHYSSSVSSSVS